jgi:hypothetical protein
MLSVAPYRASSTPNDRPCSKTAVKKTSASVRRPASMATVPLFIAWFQRRLPISQLPRVLSNELLRTRLAAVAIVPDLALRCYGVVPHPDRDLLSPENSFTRLG